jgi:hypothetical protein
MEGGVRDTKGNFLPPIWAFFVRVHGGHKPLHHCQLKFGENPNHEYVASAPFDLRPQEYKDLPVLRMRSQNGGLGAFPILYFLRATDWVVAEDGAGLLLAPGNYCVRVFSEECPPAALMVELKKVTNDGNPYDWTMTPCTSISGA